MDIFDYIWPLAITTILVLAWFGGSALDRLAANIERENIALKVARCDTNLKSIKRRSRARNTSSLRRSSAKFPSIRPMSHT